MDIPRPDLSKAKRKKRIITFTVIGLVLVRVTILLSQLKPAALIATGMVGSFSAAQNLTDPPKRGTNKPPAKPPALNPDQVRETVGQAHRSLEAGRALVEAAPLLVNACWDWGGGDFETPHQAAAHTGGREIAEYLLVHHARQDVYATAILGELKFVQTALARRPSGFGGRARTAWLQVDATAPTRAESQPVQFTIGCQPKASPKCCIVPCSSSRRIAIWRLSISPENNIYFGSIGLTAARCVQRRRRFLTKFYP